MGKAKRNRPVQRMERAPAGTHLGDLGGEVREGCSYPFTWLGREWHTHPDLSMLAEVDLVEKALELDEGDPRQMTFIKDQMRLVVHEDDFDQFWEVARKSGQEIDDFQQLTGAIFAGIAGRPTGRPDDSSPGPQTTGPKSADDSSSEDAVIQRRLAGRPDLQLAVYQADVAAQQRTG
jgi:hypothetical protein